ncbi:MAG: SpoIIE family protein phosphatase [Deltaproteobacteria bacterium]|nr:SpoIIE family protein phosphatase [Deltaproteobacteria bacterium]MBW2152927.1 SpoIIE family protein phosphatase [Deltaproteobacteria bacterium]
MTAQNIFSILVVDDNRVNVKLLENALGKAGYRVFTASEASKAISMAREIRPDLILLDIMMPGQDGFAVIRELKSDAATAMIPIIFITSRNELKSKMTGFELGAVDYITKPFHVQEVLARVRLHLKLSMATNTLIQSQAEKLRQIQNAQTSMLVSPEQVPEASFCVQYLSLLEAGGDFYDVLAISDNIFGYFVGDISGHDLATSYMTSAVKALLKQNCIPIYEPLESMRMINNVLVEILSDGKYMTACYGMLNRKTNLMTFVNAGHPPPVYVPKEGKPHFIELTGDVLGIFADVVFGVQTMAVLTGDRFFLYSDGLVERVEEKKTWVEGKQKLLEVCGLLEDVPFRQCAAALSNHMLGDRTAAVDDVVVLGIEV